MKKILLALVIGGVSGILSYYSFNWLGPLGLESLGVEGLGNFFPGLIFGLAVLLVLFLQNSEMSPIAIWRKLLFVILSTGAYLAAVGMTIVSFTIFPCSPQFATCNFHIAYLNFFIAGFTGSFLLNLGSMCFLSLFNFPKFIALSVLGGVLGLSYCLSQTDASATMFLFLIWQSFMLLGIFTKFPQMKLTSK